jgi:P-type Cu+ transporter
LTLTAPAVAVAPAGDTATPAAAAGSQPRPAAEPDPARRLRERLLPCAVLATPVVALAVLPPWQFPNWQWISLTLAAPVAGWGAWPFHRAALSGLRRGAVTADLLVSAAVTAAFAWSVHALLTGPAGAPDFVHRSGGGHLHLALAAGLPTFLLAVRLLEAGAGVRRVPGPAERLAAAAVPAVLALAVATLGFRLGSDADAATAVAAAVAVLVAGCPCALGLAVVTVLRAGAGHAARLGLHVADPAALPAAGRVDTVVLDRAGTLTTGRTSLVEVHPAGGVDEEEVLLLAGAIAEAAEHPVARAVAEAARARCGELPGVAEFDELAGLGVRGIVARIVPGPGGDTVVAHAVLVGRPELLDAHDIVLPAPLAAAADAARAAGRIAVPVAWDGHARAVLVVADAIRPGAAAVVARLRSLGLAPVLVTADDAATARGLAARVGIGPDAVVAEVPPAGRAAAVRRLQERGRVVALVDGVTGGAPADLGVVPGPGAGRAVTLLRADLPVAAEALRLARRTLATVRVTLIGAVAPQVVALPLAVAGLLDPLAAGAAAALSALLVGAAGLPLRYTRARPAAVSTVPPACTDR